MSANNDEVKVSRTFDGTQKAFPVCMTWIKGVLMYKGIAHIIKVAFKNVLPETENASRQMVE